MAKNMTPNLRQKVWKNPESSGDEEVRPPLVGGDDSSDDELIEDQGDKGIGQHVAEYVYDTDDEMVFSDWLYQDGASCRGERKGAPTPIQWQSDPRASARQRQTFRSLFFQAHAERPRDQREEKCR